jgi:hypothetical protein
MKLLNFFFSIVVLALMLAIGVSWVVNLSKLVSCDFSPETPYKCEIIHAIGIIPPVALVTAWMNTEQN